MTAARGPGRPDTVGHSSVQAWSAGPLFPAIIARIERPDARNSVVLGWEYPTAVSFELTIGAFVDEYATREDAETVARWACAGGRIIPERYAQLVPGAGRSMAAFGAAMVRTVNDQDYLHAGRRELAMAPDVRPEDVLP